MIILLKTLDVAYTHITVHMFSHGLIMLAFVPKNCKSNQSNVHNFYVKILYDLANM